MELSRNGDFFESDLTLKALIGVYDSPRVESAGAVNQYHQAGISIQMPTGDRPGPQELLLSKPADREYP